MKLERFDRGFALHFHVIERDGPLVAYDDVEAMEQKLSQIEQVWTEHSAIPIEDQTPEQAFEAFDRIEAILKGE